MINFIKKYVLRHTVVLHYAPMVLHVGSLICAEINDGGKAPIQGLGGEETDRKWGGSA